MKDTTANSATQPDARAAQRSRRRVKYWIAGVALVIGIGLNVPTPYVVESPGPTYDVSHEVKIDLDQLRQRQARTLTPEQAAAQEAALSQLTLENPDGQLRMVTVQVAGNPDMGVPVWRVMQAWFNPQEQVSHVAEIFPPDLSSEQLTEIEAQMMTTSQSDAIIAGLRELGVKIPAQTIFRTALDESPLRGQLADGDVITAITPAGGPTYPIAYAGDIFAVMSQIPPQTEVSVSAQRGDQTITATGKTMPAPERSGSLLGITLNTGITEALDEVKFGGTEDIGGPSAGTVFALSLIDNLDGKKLLQRDNSVAVTGEITQDGRVQPIGGVVQKMYGAKRDGAQYFILPAANCAEAVTDIPAHLQIIPVQNLHEAYQTLEAIGSGQAATLASCPRP